MDDILCVTLHNRAVKVNFNIAVKRVLMSLFLQSQIDKIDNHLVCYDVSANSEFFLQFLPKQT